MYGIYSLPVKGSDTLVRFYFPPPHFNKLSKLLNNTHGTMGVVIFKKKNPE